MLAFFLVLASFLFASSPRLARKDMPAGGSTQAHVLREGSSIALSWELHNATCNQLAHDLGSISVRKTGINSGLADSD